MSKTDERELSPKQRRRERANRRARAEIAAAKRSPIMAIVGGLMIDVADVITLGGLGGVGGFLVGGLLTFGVCSSQGVSRFRTAALTMAGAVYCALPFTEALPLATLLALVSQLAPRAKALPAAASDEPAGELAMDPVRVSQAGPGRR
jgi:hypothetical protein